MSRKISAFPDGSPILDDDQFVIERVGDGYNYKFTATELAAYFAANGGSKYIVIEGSDGEDGISIPGIAGEKGAAGIPGFGFDGLDGEDGVAIPGAAGPQGAKGDSGFPGAGGAIGYYGVFYSTVDQTAVLNTPTAMTLNTTPEAVGVSIVSSSRIVFENAGTYNIQFSAQIHHQGGGGSGDTVFIWFKLNGTDIPDSSTSVTITSSSKYEVAAWNFMLTVAAGQYVELYWQTDNDHIILEDVVAGATTPATPSLIVTAHQIMYTQLGPQGVPGLDGLDADDPLIIPGAIGATGATGSTGATGPAGAFILGTDGEDGADGIGVVGPVGATGQAGSAGSAGITSVVFLPSEDPEEPLVIPGRDGVAGSTGTPGSTGATGAAGTTLYLEPELPEDPMMIPGATGAAGAAGANGTIGRDGVTIYLQPDDPEEPLILPGSVGATGPAGAGTAGRNGNTIYIEPELPEDPLLIPGPAGASGVPAANSVTRAMLSSTSVTGGKNWVFLGQGTASAATSTGTITWAGTFKQLMVEYFISGYAGNGIGRILVANSGTPSPTATTCCTSIIVGVTAAPATPVSNSGWPTAIAAGLVPRYGWLFVENTSGVVKRATGQGQYGGTAPTTVPTSVRIDGMSSQTTLIQTLVMTSYTLATGNVIGGTMNAGTFVNVWGRNDD